jgi:hypothetical protein
LVTISEVKGACSDDCASGGVGHDLRGERRLL